MLGEWRLEGTEPSCWAEHVLDGCEMFVREEGACVVERKSEEEYRGRMMDLLEDWNQTLSIKWQKRCRGS